MLGKWKDGLSDRAKELLDKAELEWSESEYEKIRAEYPELSEDKIVQACENVDHCLCNEDETPVMELFAASCEGINNE